MQSKVCNTYVVTIHVAGDISEAKKLLARECHMDGLCVTVEPETFVYTGGREEGVRVGMLNYPRFPTSELGLKARACHIAQLLMAGLYQRSALVVCPDDTIWYTEEPPGVRSEETPAKTPHFA